MAGLYLKQKLLFKVMLLFVCLFFDGMCGRTKLFQTNENNAQYLLVSLSSQLNESRRLLYCYLDIFIYHDNNMKGDTQQWPR